MKKIERELGKLAGPVRVEIKNGKYEKLKEFIKEHLDFAVNHGLMHVAAEYNNVEALKVFVDAGVDPDSISEVTSRWHVPLESAIRGHAYKAAAYLLHVGADIENTFNGHAPSPLTSAASDGDLKMVKLFLERGADIHSSYLRDGKERFNALKWAVIEGHQEVADYLRSKG
ncbi:MAG: ankyrin repeat domain-containing protein, partial [Thermoguttaceae bacterium]